VSRHRYRHTCVRWSILSDPCPCVPHDASRIRSTCTRCGAPTVARDSRGRIARQKGRERQAHLRHRARQRRAAQRGRRMADRMGLRGGVIFAWSDACGSDWYAHPERFETYVWIGHDAHDDRGEGCLYCPGPCPVWHQHTAF
jgi:hypothetical protein